MAFVAVLGKPVMVTLGLRFSRALYTGDGCMVAVPSMSRGQFAGMRAKVRRVPELTAGRLLPLPSGMLLVEIGAHGIVATKSALLCNLLDSLTRLEGLVVRFGAHCGPASLHSAHDLLVAG